MELVQNRYVARLFNVKSPITKKKNCLTERTPRLPRVEMGLRPHEHGPWQAFEATGKPVEGKIALVGSRIYRQPCRDTPSLRRRNRIRSNGMNKIFGGTNNRREKNESSLHDRLPRSLRIERYSGSGQQPTHPPSQELKISFPVAFPPCGGWAFVPFTAAGQRGNGSSYERHPSSTLPSVVDVCGIFNTPGAGCQWLSLKKHNI